MSDQSDVELFLKGAAKNATGEDGEATIDNRAATEGNRRIGRRSESAIRAG
jgi:hypothetical protein